jgi:threonine dehydratase
MLTCGPLRRKKRLSRRRRGYPALMAEAAAAATVVPSFNDVLAARDRIGRYLQPTALHRYPALDELVGTETWVKHENHQPICAFKVRGGINLVSQLSEDERRRGVITASTGNHGQSIAYAARLFGVRAIICVPEAANPVKVSSIRGLGAEIVIHGVDFDEARVHASRLAEENGYRYIHSGNEPYLIAGVGTQALEILERQPDIEVIIVPIGGGSGAAGTCIVAKAINPKIRVIGVQSAEAPAAYKSWKARRLLEDRMGTIAEGLATRTAFELPQRILWDKLDDFVLVPDAELRTAVRLMIETTRNLAEPAGAAPLAAALRLTDQLRGKRVALVLSGSNITPAQLKELLAA